MVYNSTLQLIGHTGMNPFFLRWIRDNYSICHDYSSAAKFI